MSKNLKYVIILTLVGLTPWICIVSFGIEDGKYIPHSAVFAFVSTASVILLIRSVNKQTRTEKRMKLEENKMLRKNRAERAKKNQAKEEREKKQRLLEGKKMWKILENRYRRLIKEHVSVLSRKKEQFSRKGDYQEAIFDDESWNQELHYFIYNVLHSQENQVQGEMSPWLKELIEKYNNDKHELRSLIDEFVYYEFGSSVTSRTIDIIEDEIRIFRADNKNQSLKFNKSMTPFQYEKFCSRLLVKNGWDSRVTQKIGDQGVDIVAEKEGIKVAIQCKKYSGHVTNKAVQEIHAGKDYYDANYAVVVTNSSFTESAKKLSGYLNVILLHHDQLSKLDVSDGNLCY